MRLSAAVLGATLAAGLGVGGGGRAPSVDMVAVRYSDSLPSPTHLGHWTAPVPGRVTLVAAAVVETGVDPVGLGAGTLTLGVSVEGRGTLCSLAVPCTSLTSDFHEQACAAEVAAGERVHLEYSHGCGTAPLGNAVFGFEWRR